jgi:STE24 endopeptidase
MHTEQIDGAVSLDKERQEEAREYARIRRRWMLGEIVFTLALLLVFWLSGLSVWLRDALIGGGLTNPWALTAVYVLILELAATLIFLPSGYWTGFVLPHRYGLSTQTLGGWLADQGKVLGLEIVLGIPIVQVIYGLLRSQPDTWWIWGAALMLVISLIFGALAPVVLVPLFYKLKPLEDEALIERVKRLAERTGTRVAAVNTIDLSSRTTAANAMVMGLGATKTIALGDTLYEEYSVDEIEAVLAHELAHQVHHDLELGIAVNVVTTVGGFYLAHLTLRWGVEQFGFEGVADLAAIPLVILVATLASLLIMPLIKAFSRWRERMADRYALDVIDNPEAFANAMTRLSNQNLAEADPPKWVVWLLYDHPPIRERLELARGKETAS